MGRAHGRFPQHGDRDDVEPGLADDPGHVDRRLTESYAQMKATVMGRGAGAFPPGVHHRLDDIVVSTAGQGQIREIARSSCAGWRAAGRTRHRNRTVGAGAGIAWRCRLRSGLRCTPAQKAIQAQLENRWRRRSWPVSSAAATPCMSSEGSACFPLEQKARRLKGRLARYCQVAPRYPLGWSASREPLRRIQRPCLALGTCRR